ncbi:MAG: carbohydrate binding family 9 domain-containing protein [Cytophagales bacterium]|nr:carbohydrate binding family 9 domain-containing protein [Cytophagales bacterium]
MMPIRKLIITGLVLQAFFFVSGQDSVSNEGLLAKKEKKEEDKVEAIKSYSTGRIDKSTIIIDGKLDDEAWGAVEWGGDFVGHRPEFNVEPSQETAFKILYDDKYLYVGVRAFDTEPEKIVERMSRRDGFDGDFVEINIDSYNDKRTAFSFTASVSGVKGDEYISNNGNNWDSTWDPIWYLKTSIDDQGWIAEFKIPLSQLRFANKDHHTWGIQFTRRFFRKEERSTWQKVDPNAPGWVHLFGELNGISGIESQKQLEIQPYVVGSTSRFPSEEGNPYRDGTNSDANIGLDAKIGITSDITLDLTVNPDFGQVNADPSQVNLSAFQLFFREQRPFFLEGANVLSFGTSNGQTNLFYSRRIGARPSGYPDSDDEYVDSPNNTRILGAAKITGKNSKGFSWGFLESVTNKERADVTNDGQERKEIIEPLTNYSVARVQQDLNGGKTVFGAIATNVSRFNNNKNGLEFLHDNAQTAGVDLTHNFKGRKYGFDFKYGLSRVNGSQGAIYDNQTSSVRFFQRPDNDYKSVDSTRTSLAGTFGTFSFGKKSGNWNWEAGTNYKSPELDLNDIGFMQQTDNWNHWVWSQYKVNKPVGIFRSQRYNMYTERNFDFGGVSTGGGTNFNSNFEFKNFWNFGAGFWAGTERSSNSALRGGPSMILPGNFNFWYWLGTNSQKKVRVSWNQWYNWGNDDSRKSSGISLGLTIRPTDALSVRLSPQINLNENAVQYIAESNGTYLLGRIRQTTYSMSMRVNYNLTPNLTLEFWGQPFISSGEYSEFKRVSSPNASQFEDRFVEVQDSWVTFADDYYEIDEDGGGVDYSFDNPDFNVVQFRSNFVVRWEYTPGSTLFLVWANNGSYFDQSNKNGFGNLRSELGNLKGTNTFLIKYTYRFLL